MKFKQSINLHDSYWVIAGASTWPNLPSISSGGSSEEIDEVKLKFRNSHASLVSTLCSNSVGLKEDNILDLFDSDHSSVEMWKEISAWLSSRKKTEADSTIDVFFYYIGHGDFYGDNIYYLPIKSTEESLRSATGLSIDTLKEVLYKGNRRSRRYVFLDSCYSGAAFTNLQSSVAPTIRMEFAKGISSTQRRIRSNRLPKSGTTLICATSHNKVARIMEHKKYTMFTGSIIDVLANGTSSYGSSYFSIRSLTDAIWEYIESTDERKVRPMVYSPDQSDGDISEIPVFRNHAYSSDMADDQYIELPISNPSALEVTNELIKKIFTKRNILLLLSISVVLYIVANIGLLESAYNKCLPWIITTAFGTGAGVFYECQIALKELPFLGWFISNPF